MPPTWAWATWRGSIAFERDSLFFQSLLDWQFMAPNDTAWTFVPDVEGPVSEEMNFSTAAEDESSNPPLTVLTALLLDGLLFYYTSYIG